jgi:uncharacterized phage protein (TIGR02218 family)
MPYPVAAGDTVTVVAGCDRRRITCVGRFANIANFRGAPDLPGQDSILVVSSNQTWTEF